MPQYKPDIRTVDDDTEGYEHLKLMMNCYICTVR